MVEWCNPLDYQLDSYTFPFNPYVHYFLFDDNVGIKWVWIMTGTIDFDVIGELF